MPQLSLVRLTLDSGLDGITYTRGNTNPTLPRDRDTHPSGIGRRPQLEALLEMPNLDTYLRDALMPSFNHPELLNRVQFERTLKDLQDRLRNLRNSRAVSKKQGNHGEAQTDGGPEADALAAPLSQEDVDQACAALERESALRSDVWNYLNAMHPG